MAEPGLTDESIDKANENDSLLRTAVAYFLPYLYPSSFPITHRHLRQ